MCASERSAAWRRRPLCSNGATRSSCTSRPVASMPRVWRRNAPSGTCTTSHARCRRAWRHARRRRAATARHAENFISAILLVKLSEVKVEGHGPGRRQAAEDKDALKEVKHFIRSTAPSRRAGCIGCSTHHCLLPLLVQRARAQALADLARLAGGPVATLYCCNMEMELRCAHAESGGVCSRRTLPLVTRRARMLGADGPHVCRATRRGQYVQKHRPPSVRLSCVWHLPFAVPAVVACSAMTIARHSSAFGFVIHCITATVGILAHIALFVILAMAYTTHRFVMSPWIFGAMPRSSGAPS